MFCKRVEVGQISSDLNTLATKILQSSNNYSFHIEKFCARCLVVELSSIPDYESLSLQLFLYVPL